jgi:transcriptional regulator with XRE-family HTH domain
MKTKLALLIFSKEISQREISKKTGIPESMLSRYKNGLNIPGNDLMALAKFFKMKPAELVGHVSENEYSMVS